MSLLDSRINSIAAFAIDASVSKADTANPTLYGGITFNPIRSQPNNYFTSNVPSTFNTTVSIVNDLYVYGNAHFNTQITVQSLITTISALDVEGKTLLNGATTISSDLYVATNSVFNGPASMLSDLYVSGNTYFGDSSIGSYLKISDFNSTMSNQYYTNTTCDSTFQKSLNFSAIAGT
jgi:hypothetical protein